MFPPSTTRAKFILLNLITRSVPSFYARHVFRLITDKIRFISYAALEGMVLL